MKKILIILASILLFACNTNEKVNFNLDIKGNVAGAVSPIHCTFQTNVANIDQIPNGEFAPLHSNAEAYTFIRRQVMQEVGHYYPNGAIYDISVKGFVEWNGLKFEVNENWKNK